MLLQRVSGLDDFGSRDGSAAPGTSERLVLDGHDFNTHPIVRLTDRGIDWGVAPEPGDEIGFGMHPYRQDDCFQAAIATCTQVAIEQVPDLALDRRFTQGEDRDEISRTSWERIDEWAKKRGLEMRVFGHVPLSFERWIGVIKWRPPRGFTEAPPPESWWRAGREGKYGKKLAPFQDHCVVMCRDRLWFDPSCSVRVPTGAVGRLSFDPSDVTYGIAFKQEEENGNI